MDFRTIKEYREALDSGKVTAIELLNQVRDKIKEKKDLNIFVEVYGKEADEWAKKADELIKEKKSGPLTGIPISIKDNICISGLKSSAGSKVLENFVSTYSSTVVKNILEAGMVPVGRTNMDEFAMGSTTENSAFNPTKNPIDTKKVPGGSSGGAAASVAAGIVPVALGSDTGGSVRQPASFCGCIGLKPTYGSVSRYGLIALSSSLDVIGPVANTIEDTETIFNVINKEKELKDSTFGSFSEVEKTKDKMKLCIPKNVKEGVDKDIMESFERSLDVFKSNGYEIVEKDLPISKNALSMYYIIQPAEASSNLARFDGMRYGTKISGNDLLEEYINTRNLFGDEVKRRILVGNFVLLSEHYDEFYQKAYNARECLAEELSEALSEFDAILTPTTVSAPFDVGSVKDPITIYKNDFFTVPASLAGLPAISVPIVEKSPIGIHITSGYNKEDTLFKLGKIIEVNR